MFVSNVDIFLNHDSELSYVVECQRYAPLFSPLHLSLDDWYAGVYALPTVWPRHPPPPPLPSDVGGRHDTYTDDQDTTIDPAQSSQTPVNLRPTQKGWEHDGGNGLEVLQSYKTL